MERKPSFAIVTLGCKVNQYDSWQIARQLKAKGFRQVPFGAPADVVIVNACAVTHVAEAKSRKMLSRARRSSPYGFVVFTGCAAELLLKQGVQLESSDLMVGNEEKDRLADILWERMQQRKATPLLEDALPYASPLEEEDGNPIHERVRAFLKVQEGCDKFCTFCIVPFTRGKPRSKPLPQVVAEARELVEEFGFPEIVLTGVCLSLWGQEFGSSLADLLRAVHQIPGLKRLRLSSLDPRDIDERFIRTCAELEKLCPHFHLSLQSGSDEILQAMGRGHDTDYFLRLVEAFRTAIPEVAFTTDIMVGFPGETERHFDETVHFVRKVGFLRLHVFRYSPRPDTPAATLPNPVPPPVAEERSSRLIAVSKELWLQFARSFLGKNRPVLVENCVPEGEGFVVSGLTDNYLRVWCRSRNPVELGTIVPVRLTEVREDRECLWGEVAQQSELLSSPQPLPSARVPLAFLNE